MVEVMVGGHLCGSGGGDIIGGFKSGESYCPEGLCPRFGHFIGFHWHATTTERSWLTIPRHKYRAS